jgi:hypothetical protein
VSHRAKARADRHSYRPARIMPLPCAARVRQFLYVRARSTTPKRKRTAFAIRSTQQRQQPFSMCVDLLWLNSGGLATYAGNLPVVPYTFQVCSYNVLEILAAAVPSGIDLRIRSRKGRTQYPGIMRRCTSPASKNRTALRSSGTTFPYVAHLNSIWVSSRALCCLGLFCVVLFSVRTFFFISIPYQY